MTLFLQPAAFPIAVAGSLWANDLFASLGEDLGASVLNLLYAVLILVVGWIVAWAVSSFIKSALKRTKLDNQIAQWFVGEGGSPPKIEDWVGTVVYWIILLFAIIASLEALELKQVSEPLQSLLNEVTRFLPQVGGAAILLGAAWVVATIVRMIVLRALHAARLDERLGEQTTTSAEPTTSSTTEQTPAPGQSTSTGSGSSSLSLTETLGNTIYWFIFLLFLPAILSTLQLEGTLDPVQGLLDKVLAILPNILAAVLIAFVGWLIAQVVRRVVTNLLAAAGADQVGEKFGLAGTEKKQKASWILGTVVYVLVLIPVAISALQALKIAAISDPAITMLEQVLATLPQVATAIVILVAAYIVGRYISELVTTLLTGFGFNNLPQWLGFTDAPATPATTTTTTPNAPIDAASVGYETSGAYDAPIGSAGSTSGSTPKTPSEIVGTVTLVAIILVATLTAVDILNIPALTELVSGIMLIAGQVLLGVVIFTIGLYLANLAFNLITMSGNRQSQIIGHAARISIIVFVSAMALRQMGIAPDIVNLAFGLIGGAIAVAVALSFGLGGREIAAEQTREWLNDFKRRD